MTSQVLEAPKPARRGAWADADVNDQSLDEKWFGSTRSAKAKKNQKKNKKKSHTAASVVPSSATPSGAVDHDDGFAAKTTNTSSPLVEHGTDEVDGYGGEVGKWLLHLRSSSSSTASGGYGLYEAAKDAMDFYTQRVIRVMAEEGPSALDRLKKDEPWKMECFQESWYAANGNSY